MLPSLFKVEGRGGVNRSMLTHDETLQIKLVSASPDWSDILAWTMAMRAVAKGGRSKSGTHLAT